MTIPIPPLEHSPLPPPSSSTPDPISSSYDTMSSPPDVLASAPLRGPLEPNAFELELEDESPESTTRAQELLAQSREERLRRRNQYKDLPSEQRDVDDEAREGMTIGTRTRRTKSSTATEHSGHGLGHHHRSGSGASGLSEARRLVKERIKSPLISGIKLEDLRDQLEIGIEKKFAPLNIPPHRRLQTAAVAMWALFLPLSVIVLLLCMSFPPFWIFLIPYFIFIQFDTAPDNGGRAQEWARRGFLWRYFAQYYPCSIVKEADLPPDRPYLFGYHPHGIIGMGAFATFATEGTHFSELFPGIKPHLLTLESNFKIPFYRELIMIHGVGSVAKKSCANVLAQGPGSAITIVIGGAAESLSAHPGTADLTLKKRFGFVKMAIKAGADLVPVFSFGENDIYEQMANAKGSWVYKIQRKVQKVFGFTLPLFYGHNYGLMPFRHPIVSVIGTPIHTIRDPHPSDEVIQEVQQQYIDELMRIWDKYKDLYAKGRTRELTLVE
ncbi:hypothetical protein IAR55_006912 [Kwoniella newhampshirensis]|uniref:Diacylglycerol O-acyltransferase n=1 Tax=Kwoniella newhampshirensis TaxID=1651941 RepID=A0AAW0YTY2_9TREE